MCGIVGYFGDNEGMSAVVEGLTFRVSRVRFLGISG